MENNSLGRKEVICFIMTRPNPSFLDREPNKVIKGETRGTEVKER